MPQAHSSFDTRLTELAGQWFLDSGIRHADGGVARYHQYDSSRNARTSTEITGYSVSALLFLYERHDDRAYLEAAERSARFLTRTAWSPSLKTFPFEHSADGDAAEPLTYFFDCGIIVRGLVALWRVGGDPEYLEVAAKAGDSMARDFATGDTWHPILGLPGKYPLPWKQQWSRRPGCYQLKSALAWHELHQATGLERFGKHYEAALRKTMAIRDEFLPAETREKTMDRLHAYCYFLEGLFPVADRMEVRQALSEGIRRVRGYLRDIAPEFARSDVYAQLLRVRILASQNCGLPMNDGEAFEEAAAIEQFQVEQPDSPHHGGFWFGRKQGQLLPFVNPVSAAFCLQAYAWWQDYQAGRSISQAII